MQGLLSESMNRDDPSCCAGELSAASERPPPVFVGSDLYRKQAFGFNHPLNIVRHSAVVDLLKMLGWLSEDEYRESEPASVTQLIDFHDRAYVRALQYANSTGVVEPRIRERYQVGTLENPLFPGLFERASMTVGGSIVSAVSGSFGVASEVPPNTPIFLARRYWDCGDDPDPPDPPDPPEPPEPPEPPDPP